MKIYLTKDKMSNQVVDVNLSQNLDTYKRQFINAYLDVKQKNNFAAIRLWNDCEIYEVSILLSEEISNPVYKKDLILWGDCNYSDNGIVSKKVLVLKDFINDFETKQGSVLDKSE